MNVKRIMLVVAMLAMIFVASSGAFAADVAHHRGRGYYPRTPHHHGYHHGHHYDHYYSPHFGPPPPPHYRPHYRPYYRPRVYYGPGVHFVTPRASIGIHF